MMNTYLQNALMGHLIMDSQFSRANAFSFFLFSLIFSSYCPPRVASDGGGDEFSYKEETGKGPSKWGQLKAEWKSCSDGKMQSPIDIVDKGIKIQPDSGELKRDYLPAKAAITSRGHDVMVSWEGNGGRVHINGTDYKIVQCHWHCPSEHTINGKQYEMELHLVHQNVEGAVAVFGFLYELGAPDAFLSKILPRDPLQPNTPKLDVGILNAGDLDIGTEYYRYPGSLTTPPCSEGVIWIVAKQVKTVSKEQVEALKAAVSEEFKINARPVQPLNAREVVGYTPGKEPNPEM